MAIPLDAYEPTPTPRRRGDFRRRGTDGPPIVVSVDRTRKRKGLKADLQAQADAAGIDHTGMTVDDLHAALGPEPRDEVYGRPSGYGDTIEPMWNLMKHHEREIVFGLLGFKPSTVDQWCEELSAATDGIPEFYDAVSDNPDARRILDRIAARCGDLAGRHNASARGSWIHALTEWADEVAR